MPPNKEINLETLYERYLKFIAIPKASRIASQFAVVTKEDFAKHYGVTLQDLAHLEDRSDFQTRYSAARKEWARSKTPEMLEILYQKYLRTQSTQDLKLWLELTGEINGDKKQDSTVNNVYNLFNISDDQKKAILKRAQERLISGSGN